MAKRILASVAALAWGAGAMAQFPAPLPTSGMTLKGGYYWGSTFDGATPGSRVRLEGFELGVDLTLVKLQVVELRLSPSVVFGGSAQSGSDTDGNIFRIVGGAKFRVPSQPWYVVFASGFAATQNRGGHAFNTTSGAIGQFTVGYDSGSKGPVRLPILYEATWTFGSDQLSGIAFDIGVRF